MSNHYPGFSQEEVEFQDKVRHAEYEEVVVRLQNQHQHEDIKGVVNSAAIFAVEIRDNIADPMAPPVACKDKCHWCCHQAVGATPPEIMNIVWHINETFSAKEKSKIIKNLEKLDSKSRGLNIKQRARLNMPCAFLAFGRCSIYSVRPLTCRRQTSYNADDCKKSMRFGGAIETEKPQMIAYNGIMQGLVQGLSTVFPDHQLGFLELTSATLTALKDDKVCDEWLAGESSFSGCELIAE